MIRSQEEDYDNHEIVKVQIAGNNSLFSVCNPSPNPNPNPNQRFICHILTLKI